MLNEQIIDTMIHMAMEATENAYLKYRKFPVGACVLASDGTLYAGSIIENAILQLSITAEQAAMIRALNDGKREFDAIAVVADTEDPYVPSGSSCQFIAEFGMPEIVMANMHGQYECVKLSDLLPYGEKMRNNHRYKEAE